MTASVERVAPESKSHPVEDDQERCVGLAPGRRSGLGRPRHDVRGEFHEFWNERRPGFTQR